MGQSPSSKNYTDNPKDWILIQGNADLKSGKVVPRIYTSQLTKKADIGDIILTVRAPVGEVAITDYNAVLGRGVAAIKGNLFIYFSLEKFKANNKWNMYSSGSTFDSITGKDLNNLPLFFPSEIEENKIGVLLNKLDNLLALYERKLKLLSRVKKYFLDNLFAEKEYPNLRFKEFTDAWEQRKLGEISETYSGGTPKVSIKSFYNKKEIPFIRSSDIHKNTTELYITKEGLEESSAKLVSKGQILYALYGATSGEVDISKIDGAINQAILAINTHDNINYFIMLFLNKNKDKIIKKYIQGGQGNLSAKIVKNININITSKKEEKEISTFIKKFEKIFTLYENKQQHLTEIKKTLLNTMFI